MDDHELSKFIPMYGDRVIVRSFVRNAIKGNTNQPKKRPKSSMLSSLRKTIKSMRGKKKDSTRSSDSESEGTNKYIGNKNAAKDTRQVKLVPMKLYMGQFVKIRTQKGGGPRKLTTKKSAKKDELIKLGKQIFFGKTEETCKLGLVTDFTFELQNYEGEIMNDHVSVGELYDSTGLTLLTFYFLMTPVDEELPKLVTPKKNKKNKKDATPKDKEEGESQNEAIQDKEGESTMFTQSGTDLLGQAMFASGIDGSLDNIPDFLEIETDVIVHASNFSLQDLNQNASPGMLPGIDVDIIPLERKIRVHRTNLLYDMIEVFKQYDIINTKLSFEYINEVGADLDGVSRDVYSVFWIEFFRCSSEGEECRVPALNTRWQAEEWMSIGRILAKGYQDYKIFPLQLSKVSAIVIAFGEDALTTNAIFDTFLNFVSRSDRELIQSALQEDLFGDDKEDLLDLLDRFGCGTIPTKNNMRSIVDQIAHKELIQKPKYAMDNMATTSRETLMGTFLSVDNLLKLYEDLEPTPKKVLKILKADPSNNAENASLRFLQQYIKGQNSFSLKKLLRFLTGSETISVSKIDVNFTQLEGLNRRPIAHTCGPTLELQHIPVIQN